MDKETKLRGILFCVIGFLLVLSLVICICIVAGESKLVPVEATVTNVTKDAAGSGVDSVEITYTVDDSIYSTQFESKKDLKTNDKINVYYYSNNVKQVKYSKTSKLIFLCPLVGLLLCALGIFEIYRRKNDGEDEFKTAVIGVVGNTEQLKVVTESEATEEKVKEIAMPVDLDLPKQIEEVPQAEVEYDEVSNGKVVVHAVELDEEPTKVEPVTVPPTVPATVPVTEPATVPATEPATVPAAEPVTVPATVPATKPVKDENASANVESSIEESILAKVKEKKNLDMSEDDLKEAIKDALADVIKEAKEEKKNKPVRQIRVIPNYYYISGTSLMYEEMGKDKKELNLKDVTNVVRTVNQAGNVVKLVVESPAVKCILTNMKNIDLEQLSNLLRNKMRAMNEDFEEVVEHKEY